MKKKTVVLVAVVVALLGVGLNKLAHAGGKTPPSSASVTIDRTNRWARADSFGAVRGTSDTIANVVSSVFVYAGQSPQFSIQITDGSGSTVSCSSTDPSLVQVGTTIHTDSGVYVTWDVNQNCYSLQVLARSAQAPMQP